MATTIYKESELDFVWNGDSLIEPDSIVGNFPGEMAPNTINGLLIKEGIRMRPQARNYSVTSLPLCQLLGRGDIIGKHCKPAIGGIVGGTNDNNLAETGTSPATGTPTIIYLKSSGQKGRNAWQNQVITLTGGTGSGQSNTIISYFYDWVNNRGVATLLNAWSGGVITDNTTQYSIATSSMANIQANAQACIKQFKYGVFGAGRGLGTSFYSQNELPANGKPGERYLIYNDTSTTGGTAVQAEICEIDDRYHPNISGSVSSNPKQSVWEFRNIQSGESGWGRVAVTGTKAWYTKIIIFVNAQYLNFTAPGYDNYNVNTSTGTQFPDYIDLRTAQAAAVAAENINFTECAIADIYSYQSKTIYGGTITVNGDTITIPISQAQGSAAMFINQGTNNRHYNNFGQTDGFALPVFYTIMNNPDWVEYLKRLN